MYNIAVVGCGGMSNEWIRYAKTREDCQIVCMVDPIVSSAEKKVHDYGLNARVYSDLPTALAKEDVNLVFNVTPPEFHYQAVITALNAGCDVFGEKPMADTLENGYKMVECAERTGKNYFVMQNRRYEPYLYAMRNFLAEKPLGDIGQVSANFQVNPHFGGFRDQMDSPLIADMAIHTFDAARFLLGKNPVSVYCNEFNPSWSWYRGNANAVCIFEFEDGSVFDYRGSWCANGLQTSWESEWRVQCADGCVQWDGAQELFYQKVDFDPAVGKPVSGPIIHLDPLQMPAEGHPACFDEMFAALKAGTRPQTDCRDNIKSIEMVYNAIASAREKKIIFM